MTPVSRQTCIGANFKKNFKTRKGMKNAKNRFDVISVFLLSLFCLMLFSNCEKSDLKKYRSIDSQVRIKQNNEALHALARLLVEDRKSGGEFAQKQIKRFHLTGTEEFLLVDFIEPGISPRNPEFLADLALQNPLMEVAYPSFNFFNQETFPRHLEKIKYYVVIEDGVDPEMESVDSLPAYDIEGNKIMIPNFFDENIRYAVVAMDESHDAFVENADISVKGVLQSPSLIAATPSFVKVFLESDVKFFEESTVRHALYLDGSQEGISHSASLQGDHDPRKCDRPANRKDQLYKIRFSDKAAVKKIESGFRLPNIELIIHYGISSVSINGAVNNFTTFVQVDKNWTTMDGCCWEDVDNINQQIKTWRENDADTWAVFFVESDGGQSIEFSFGATPQYTLDKKWALGFPIGFKVPAKNKDDEVGRLLIEYCDPAVGEGTAYKIYSAGSDGMYFRENLQ
jgi:hypothetical protein